MAEFTREASAHRFSALYGRIHSPPIQQPSRVKT